MPGPASAAAAARTSRLAVYLRALGYFVVAAGVAAVANGPHAIAIAAWIAPLFWLHALHRLPVLAGALIGGLFHGAATVVAARGMLPLQGGWYVLAAAGIGMGALFPFVVSRALLPRLPRGLIPLLLPVTATALEFLGSRWQPFGSFGAVAYTQMDAPALLQVAALAGLPGIALLVYLPASLAYWAIDYRPPRRQLITGITLAALLLALAFGLGADRHAPPKSISGTEVAIVSSPLHGRLSQLLAPAYATGDPAAVHWDETLQLGEVVTADLLRRTRSAARAQARIIVWPETAAIVAAAAEPALIQAAAQLTRAHGIYLAMALGVVRHRARPWPPGDGAIDNKMVLLDPAGQVVAEYHKSIAVPGPEAELLVPGAGAIPIVDTPYGRIAMAICFDLDFPRLMRRAAGADLLLVAAEDWRGITPYHSDMARLRAIEGGYALVRAARYGRSIVADEYGQLLAAQEDSSAAAATDILLHTDMNLGGVRTVYSRMGDVVGWLTVAGLFGLLVYLGFGALLGLVGPRRHNVILDERPRGAGDHRETPT